MPEEKEEFKKVALPPSLKREIAIIASSESRYEYEIVADAIKLYKAIAISKNPKKKIKDVPVQDVVSMT